jgi:hypothetical protein
MGKKDHSQQRLPVEHYRKTLGKNEKKVQHRDIKSGKLRSSKADLNSGGVGLARAILLFVGVLLACLFLYLLYIFLLR